MDAIKTTCPLDKTTGCAISIGPQQCPCHTWSRVARKAASGKLSVQAKSIYEQHMSEFARLDINKHLSRSPYDDQDNGPVTIAAAAACAVYKWLTHVTKNE